MIAPPPGDVLAQPALYRRVDETDDALFYAQPRMVLHIDESTVAALTEFYRSFIPANSDVLDLMSSWVSHLPPDQVYGQVCGLGMNAAELQANSQLTEHCVHDLNKAPQLPYPMESFDRALCCVSVQYLTQPLAVFRSVLNCLRPGGELCIATSHRLFPSKAIAAFARLAPQARIALISEYLRQAGFVDVSFVDSSPNDGDPLWLVLGQRP
ncbi:MAG: class I SAM-dependent methyltransferase [Pseudomonadales bacterium]